MDIGTDTHVFLTQGANMSVNVMGVLQLFISPPRSSSVSFRNHEIIEGLSRSLTSCSSRGTLLSFSLWTAAEAEPNSTEAVSKEVDFMTGKRAGTIIYKENGLKTTERTYNLRWWRR